MSELTDRTRALLAAATPGPWNVQSRGHDEPDQHVIFGGGHQVAGGIDYCEEGGADADLIAAAPTLLAQLCDQLDQAEAALDNVAELHHEDTVCVRGCPEDQIGDCGHDHLCLCCEAPHPCPTVEAMEEEL